MDFRERRAPGDRQKAWPDTRTAVEPLGWFRPPARFGVSAFSRLPDYNGAVHPGYQTLAADYIRRQAKRLAGQLQGVRYAQDDDFVHGARVTTRRLRAALGMFADCFPAKRLKRWRKAMRRTTTVLGKARDRDVQIQFLCDTLGALNVRENVAGVAQVLAQLEHDRRRLQRKLLKAIDHLERKGILGEMRRTAKRAISRAKSKSQAPNMQAPRVLAEVARQVLRRLDKLLQHQDSLGNPDDRPGHHAMRIAAKRLRYTMEISRPTCPGQLDGAVKAMKKLQTLLGDIHDCDVWMDHLDAFARKQRRRTVAAFGRAGRFSHLDAGIQCLRQDRLSRRRKTFAELLDYWSELGRCRFWEELRSFAVKPRRGELT
jgi:CHAD domain-containing protein